MKSETSHRNFTRLRNMNLMSADMTNYAGMYATNFSPMEDFYMWESILGLSWDAMHGI